MRKSETKQRQGRREFLRKVAVAGGSAVAVAAASKTVAAPAEPEAKPAAAKPASYAETEHVRAYYRTCRS
jgi:nitrous oxide reductase